jgi:hypothetical protein
MFKLAGTDISDHPVACIFSLKNRDTPISIPIMDCHKKFVPECPDGIIFFYHNGLDLPIGYIRDL